MTQTNSHWRLDRPAEGFFTTEVSTGTSAFTVRAYLPDGYQDRYAYPLLVLFHRHGSNEERVLRLAPKISRRNFVAISVRGPEEFGTRQDGQRVCGWGPEKGLSDGVAEAVVRAVEQTRRAVHVHSERVYLVGVCEGADAAYRAAFALAGRVAGVAALNGAVPRADGRPVFTAAQVRDLRVMIGHGTANAMVPFASAARDYRMFYGAGADVNLTGYAAGYRLHPDMLRDLNRWVIGHVHQEHDQLSATTR